MTGDSQDPSLPENGEAFQAICLACGDSGLKAFYESNGVPSQTCVLLDSREESESFPEASILLAYCDSCGFIQNVRFDGSLIDYSRPTEESQAFSPKFNEFAADLADDLVSRHELEGKTVLEVGCGKGDFLLLLAERGIGSGLGIDPGYLPNREWSADLNVEFRREWFESDSTHLTGDLILTRHLMEHLPNVSEFLGWLVDSALHTEGSVVFTEVPDTARVLREGAFWDIYHEHCSYFTIGSLARSLRHAGLNVTRLRHGYDGQYLLATSQMAAEDSSFDIEESPGDIAALADSFARTVSDRVGYWKQRISQVHAAGSAVAIWGGGSKAAAFLTTVPSEEAITVVDINPHKQGKWLPGSGVAVEEPLVLAERRPALVIPMNPIYVDEIRQDLHSMGLSPNVEPL